MVTAGRPTVNDKTVMSMAICIRVMYLSSITQAMTFLSPLQPFGGPLRDGPGRPGGPRHRGRPAPRSQLCSCRRTPLRRSPASALAIGPWPASPSGVQELSNRWITCRASSRCFAPPDSIRQSINASTATPTKNGLSVLTWASTIPRSLSIAEPRSSRHS